jgi:hypothetical protein
VSQVVQAGGPVTVGGTAAATITAPEGTVQAAGSVTIGGVVEAVLSQVIQASGSITIGGTVGTSSGTAVSQLTRIENLLYILLATKT